MISTGIAGTARHGMNPNSASISLVKTLARAAPPRARIASPRPRHVRGIDGIADHLEREIGLHARAHVELAVVEQRPAAVLRALRPPQIDGDLAFQLGIDRLAEIMSQQDVFGGNGAVGLELEAPFAVGLLAIEQRPRRRGNAAIEIGTVRRHVDLRPRSPAMTTSAARLPDRTALSNVAGSPVAVQSPAITRLSHCVRAAGRLAFSSGVADEGRPPLAHDLPRRQFGGNSRRPATPPAISSERASRAAPPSGGRRC